MKNSKMKFTVLATIACLIIGVVCAGIHVRAQNQIQTQSAVQFGILGIARGQTARINVANVSSPDNPLFPPDPCRVTMSFVDADGNVLINNAGQPVQREVTLQPGHAAFLQINGDNYIERGQTRLTFRPVVTVMPGDPNLPPDPCIPTLEVIDNLTARTTLLNPGVIRGFNPQPDPPGAQ